MKSWLRSQSRGWLSLAAIGLISAFVLAFVPLFNLIGYESAAFYGVLFGLTVAFLGFERLDWRGYFSALVLRLTLAVPPFVVLSATALFVKNCAYFVGVQFWFLIVCGAITVSTTLGWCVRQAISSRGIGNIAIAAVMLATIADFGLRLALEPPIIGHHWFLGYFSGSIYDEALNVPHSLLWYRGTHALLIAAIVAGVAAWRGRKRRLGAAAVLLAILGCYAFATRADHGIDLGREKITELLGGRVESEHFIIYYPVGSPLAQQVEQLVEDHEYRYAEMHAYFGTDPVAVHGKKVKSFVYANRDQKGALMGARRTLVAKIWLREIHIMWRYYGDNMLAHELAHVFTEPFGSGPLRLSTRFLLFPNMGIVEGVATAADWDSENLDPHTASAALRRLGKAPDIASLVGASGFWTQSSGLAYTLMGSFIRWLVTEYGIEKLRRAYPDGDFAGAYGVSPEQLVKRWEAFVDGLPLTDDDIELARYYYDRRSIFQKVCARTIGDLRIQVSQRASAKDGRAAIALMEEILAYDPGNVNYRIEHAQLLMTLGDVDAARAELEALLAGDLDLAQASQVRALLADVLWRGGKPLLARAQYEQCLGTALPIDARRMLLVKSGALRLDPSVRGYAYHYLVDTDVPDDLRAFFPTEWANQHPDQPLAAYLIGRRLWAARQWWIAEPYLRRGLAVPQGPLRDEAELMLVQALHFGGDSAAAAQRLDGWTPQSRTYVAARAEWIRRLDWHQARNTVDGKRR